MLIRRFLIGAVIFHLGLACSDFVFVVDGEADESVLGRTLQRRKELILKTAQQLDLSNGLHRAALVLHGRRAPDTLLVSSFDDTQSNDGFASRIREEFDNLTLSNAARRFPTSYGVTDAADVILRQILPHKRMGAPVIVLFFTDGRVRPNELPKLEGAAAKLAKKHYVHTFAINPDSSISVERFATLLLLTNGNKKSIITSQDRQTSPEHRLLALLRPFISCEQTSKFRTLRRKPIALAPASIAPTSTTTKRPTRPTRLGLRSTTSRPLSSATRTGCLYDVVFLMDFSGGAVDKREKYINIASEMIRNMNLGESATRIAFVRYSGLRRTDTVYHLRKHSNASQAIEEMAQTHL